jgi:hypothetical protein
MLLKQATVTAIANGAVTAVYRRWSRPRVHAGSRFRAAAGVIAVVSVEPCELDDIGESDAGCAGYSSRAALVDELSRDDGTLYRVELRLAGDDPRIALREQSRLGREEREGLLTALARLGARTPEGPWGLVTLRLIDARPATRAAALASAFGIDTARFKARVRQLKELGLTESLEIGYRLSPRGRAILQEVHDG